MYITNISFFCSRDEVDARLSELRNVVIPQLLVAPVVSATLMELTDMLGNPDFLDNDASFPLHVCFNSDTDRTAWMSIVMTSVLNDYSTRHGEAGPLIISTLDSLDSFSLKS